jgi:hypothetical protein
MDFWEQIKKDLQRSVREGIGKVREGVIVVRSKAGELTAEGKRRIRIFELKTKVERELSELGGRVYALSKKSGNVSSDRKVQSILMRIRKLEEKIMRLEGTAKERSKRRRTGPAGKK